MHAGCCAAAGPVSSEARRAARARRDHRGAVRALDRFLTETYGATEWQLDVARRFVDDEVHESEHECGQSDISDDE